MNEMYISLADNGARERAVLRRLLEQQPELSVAGEAADAQGLLAQARVVPPDLVLLEWEMPDLQDTDLVRALHVLGCPLKVIAYSERTEARQEALAAGADAFASREEPLEWGIVFGLEGAADT